MLRYILVLNLFLTYLSFSFQFGKPAYFIENNGQLYDENLKPNNSVEFYLINENVKLLLEKNSFSYQLHKYISNDLYSINKIEFVFLNPSPNLRVIPVNKTIEKLFFYNVLKPVKASTYEKIIYKSVWNDIDIVFYSNSGKQFFKYDIILGRKANIGDIRFMINGVDKIKLFNNELHLGIDDIKIIEKIPLSFSNNNKVFVDYLLENNIVSFKLSDEITQSSLTIDPVLNFATYFGGSQNDTGLEICTDTSNNVIITGFTMSVQNIATTGVYQTELKGSADAFIAKFSSTGQRLWASYFGGSDYDTGHSIASFVNGEIVMVGWTKSKTNIATSDAHQKFFSGGEFDSYITKFSSNGLLLWSTYYGGLNDDYINDVTINGKNEIVLVGQTTSQINISTLNSYQENLAGNFDAFLAKFDYQGRRIWGSYFGGSGLDVGMEIATDVFNEIIITGYTQSQSNIATTNAWKSELWGDWDAFLAKFNNDGNILWATYFGGNDEDNGRGVDIDGYGNIYLTGNTFSSDSLATSGVHQDTISSEESDVFIAKFNKNGQLNWATYYGGNDIDIGNMCIINAWNQCMVSGNTESSSGIVTDDAFQSINTGLTDMFYAIFDSNSHLIYGTFYGGEANDYGHGLALDKKNNIYFTGYTNSRFGISTPNAHQETLGGGYDAVLLRFNESPLEDTIIVGDIEANICADNYIEIPFTAIGDFDSTNFFIAQLSNAQGSFIDFLSIGILQSTTSGTITAYIPKGIISSDKYRIRVIATAPEIISNNEAIFLSFYELPNVSIIGDLQVCKNDIHQYSTLFNNNNQYKWLTDDGSIIGGDSSNIVSVLWDSVTTASLKLIINNKVTGCRDSSQVQITVNPNFKVNEIFGENVVCPNEEIIYYTTSNSFTMNLWEIENGIILNDYSSDTIFVKWNEVSDGKLKLTQTSVITGCSDSISMDIKINELPEPFIIGDTIVYAYNINEYRTSPNSKYIYEWKVKYGTIIGDKNSSRIEVKWENIIIDTLTLIMTDKETDCTDSLVIQIHINPNPQEIISGDTLVCANSSVTYTYFDDRFYKKWIAEGGIINSSDSSDVVIIQWEYPGNASLTLIRTDKETLNSDTILLSIRILELPEASIYGNNEICENISEVYYTIHKPGSLLDWEVINGSIIGENNLDTVIVHWDEISEDSSETAKLILFITDTTTFCTNEILYKIFQSKNPDIIIIGDSSVCDKDISAFIIKIEEESQINWTLQFGEVINFQNNTLSIIWEQVGLDTLKVIAENKNQCIDSVIFPIIINPKPPRPIITQSGNMLVSDADNGNQWFIDGEIIPGAVQKTYIPKKSGNYTVQVTNDLNCVSEMSEPIYFEINSIIYTNILTSIQPNPVKEFVLINLNSYFNDKIINLKVIDVIGNVRKNMIFNKVSNSLKIDLSDLNEGVYFIVLTAGNEKSINKIIKY